MNVWLIASCALLVLLFPAGAMTLRGTAIDRLIGLEFASAIAVFALLMIEQGVQRQSFFDLSVALAVLALPSTLLFAHVYRRWL